MQISNAPGSQIIDTRAPETATKVVVVSTSVLTQMHKLMESFLFISLMRSLRFKWVSNFPGFGTPWLV